jgi:glycine/D-amino acid oxidase-like deaminating enzyme
MSMVYDLTVIGGGIIGANLAFWANNKMPNWKISLIDQGAIGTGATQYSAGFSVPLGKTQVIREIIKNGESLLEQSRGLISNYPITNIDTIFIVSRDRVNFFKTYFCAEGLREGGKEEYNKLYHLFPSIKLSKDTLLFVSNSTHYACPRLIVEKLTNAFRGQPKNKCWEGVRVVGVKSDGVVVKLLLENDDFLLTKRLVIAEGPWAVDGLTCKLLETTVLRTKKVVAFHLDKSPTLGEPAVVFFDEDAFLLPLYERGHWLYSFTSEQWNCRPDLNELRITKEDRAMAFQIIEKFIPSITNAIKSGRVFCDAYTSNGEPCIERLPSNNNIIVAGGCSGSGYRLSYGIVDKVLKYFD